MIIWLASYPRSGNTLLRIILKSVFDLPSYSRHDDAADIGSDPKIAEMVGHQFLPARWDEAYPRMRASDELHLVKTHDAPDDVGKAIYIVRDGRASCRSFYHYMKEFPHLRARFTLRDVVAGFTPFGSWSDHLDEWDPLNRRHTLLVRYEKLVDDPGEEIERLSEFLHRPAERGWKNSFARLHKLNPRFFRAGAKNDPEKALIGDDAGIFWELHRQWMRKLQYPTVEEPPPNARAAYRAWVSNKGREFYNLSHRTYDAEQQLLQLPELHSQIVESSSRLAELRQTADAAKQREESAQAELRTAADAAKQREESAQTDLRNAAETLRKQEAESKSQIQQAAQGQAMIVAELKLAQAAARQREADLEEQMRLKRTAFETAQALSEARLTEGRQMVAARLLEWNQTAAALKAELEVERSRADSTAAALIEVQALLSDSKTKLQSQIEANSELRGDQRVDQERIAQLRSRVNELVRSNYLAQRHFAHSLQEKRTINDALAAAVQDLNTRLRMLLTSRLMQLGWKIGLGRTPYWADLAADELTDLIDLTRGASKVDFEGIDRLLQPGLEQPRDPDPVDDEHLQPPAGTMETALAHLYAKGFRPTVVLDVGAAKGYWTLNTAYRWQHAEFFMIDPLMESEPDLQKICENPRFHYLRLALGDTPGEITIHVASDPDSSSLLLTNNSDPSTHQLVEMQTIDQLLATGRIKPPQLVKVDVQGFELNVLRGASQVFQHAEVFIIEANLFEFMPGCPRVHSLVAFMAERGFYPFDFAGFLRRPFENDLGQIDVVFVSQHSPMVASNRWLGDPVDYGYPTPPPLGDELVISVIICTKDPPPEILNRTLDALDQQSISKNRFEVVVVDNASRLPLEMHSLKAGRSFDISLISEPTPGLSRARCTGISRARGELLIFVDDDNFLASDYLDRALAIAKKEPRIGLFGGIAQAEPETSIPDWKKPVLPHLGIRNYGDQPITKFADRWGEWEPIGAGMVARKSIALRFVKMFNEIPQARILGRSGSDLLSGEDSLFARAAYRDGYACSYQPALKLTHFIKAARLTTRYMSRVVEGHGRSFVLLQRALGKPVPAIKMRTAIARLIFRLRETGRAGLITGRWEIGYAREFASPSRESAVQSNPPPEFLPATIPLSVVLCTRNPRRDLLERTIDSIQQQRIERSEFELIIVDNGSDEPISQQQISQGRSMQISVVTEPRAGHVLARSAGICAARGRLILFVDDDNFLEPDYILEAIRIGQGEPSLGAFGGIAAAEFESSPAKWKLPLLKYLAVRDHGPTSVTSHDDAWGPWEPIGAGMVVRRDVAERFVQLIRNLPGAEQLGRSDRRLMSGDDALFSRLAHRLCYATSYQPALRLTHYMKAGRFRIGYLNRLIHGHGRTYVLLNLLMETPIPPISLWHTLKLLPFRIQQSGRAGLMLWQWDLGRALESFKHRRDPRATAAVGDKQKAV